MKKCSRCGETKPLEEFSKRKAAHQPWCRSCTATYNADRQAHPKRPLSPALQARTRKKRDAKGQVLIWLSQGTEWREAMARVGRRPSTYWAWRSQDPEFDQKVHAILQRNQWGDRSKYAAPNLFIEFRRRYFGMETYWHHMKMIEAIESAPDDSITLILCAPEMGKTTLLEDWVNYKLALDPNYRIGVVSESQGHARKIVGRVERRMTDESLFADYIADYGPFKAQGRDQQRPWNADHFTVLNQSSAERDFSLAARGVTSAVYGSRFDLIVFDDIQSRQNLNQTEKLLGDFRQDYLTRPGQKGRIIIIGTRVGPMDFYHALMAEEGLVDRYIAIPALNRDGESIAPEMWPKDKLLRRRQKVGEDTWAMVYMQQPGSPRSQTFNAEMIEAVKDHERGIGRGQVGLEVVCALDPALGGYCAFLAAAISRDNFWVLDAESHAELSRTEEILEHMAGYSRRYRPTTWVVEINAFQKGLVGDARLQALAQQYHFSIRPHTTGRNKTDPVLGVGSMASSFLPLDGHAPELSLPWKDDEARRKMTQLIEELTHWRPNIAGRLLKQDLVMALWFAWITWQDHRRVLEIDMPVLWRPSWLRETG